jgi:hypothetical protein
MKAKDIATLRLANRLGTTLSNIICKLLLNGPAKDRQLPVRSRTRATVDALSWRNFRETPPRHDLHRGSTAYLLGKLDAAIVFSVLRHHHARNSN